MSISFNMSAQHRIVLANSHHYEKPTEPLYLNRTLQFHDLVYLVDGQWMITENETDYQLEKDDVLLLSAGHHHYTRLPCAPKTRTICIHVTCEPGDLDKSGNSLTLPAFLRIGGFSSARHYFEKIVSIFWSDLPYKQERLSSLFNLLMLDLADSVTNTSQPDVVGEIIDLISRSPHRRFKVQEIADRFCVSTKTIENAMLRSTGLSFSKYQMSRKLEMVASQLEVEPDVRLAEVAAIFGFCDEFHLSKAFKQKYGVSPSQYKSK